MNSVLVDIAHLLGPELKTLDPYDLWRTGLGLRLKKIYYENGKAAVPIVGPFFVLDAVAPKLVRLFVQPREYPTVRSFAVLAALNCYEMTRDRKYLDLATLSSEWLIRHRSEGYHGACWGLNMPWMTKTGYAPATTPFITHTPYAVEALLKFYDITGDAQARDVALSSMGFLEHDLKLLRDEPEQAAVSYGPEAGNRVVINANSYAMMLCALLARRLPAQKDALMQKAARIFNFVKKCQQIDGSWYYYDDDQKGNFIDCFHSCIVLKNLVKYGRLAGVDVAGMVRNGLDYILETLIDEDRFLARRFAIPANPSLTKFDLYDQAELLNLLCLTHHPDLARKTHDAILAHFYIPGKRCFGSQIDIWGRLNRMKYLRWAVMPTVHAFSEYCKLMENPLNS